LETVRPRGSIFTQSSPGAGTVVVVVVVVGAGSVVGGGGPGALGVTRRAVPPSPTVEDGREVADACPTIGAGAATFATGDETGLEADGENNVIEKYKMRFNMAFSFS
jgi:hypothetical protein